MKPELQAFILADHVYQDRSSGKMIICGTFTRINKRLQRAAKPSEQPQQVSADHLINSGTPYAYIRITGVRSEVTLSFRYIDLSDNQVLMSGGIELSPENPDPVQSYEFNLPLPHLPCPHSGSYSMDVLFKDELLGHWRIEAHIEQPHQDSSHVDN